MKEITVRILFQTLITITLFSIWAGFALIIVNQFFYKELPGYTKGRLCIWELIALIIAGALAKLIIDNWGNIQLKKEQEKNVLILNSKYGVYFGIYFLIAIIVGIWQFWIFSQNY